MQVWILRIDHRHGDNSSVHRSQEGAYAALAAYVRTQWEDEMPKDEQLPSTPDEAVDAYFARMNERDEFYSVEQTELQD